MLIQKSGHIIVNNSTNIYEEGSIFIYWEGFIYGFNQQSGEKTIREFIKNLQIHGFCSAISKLHGSFVLVLANEEKQEILVASDASGQMPIYKSQDMISSSLIELTERTDLNKEDLSLDKAVEFVLTGFQFGPKVLFDAIEQIPPSKIVSVKKRNFFLINRDKEDDPFLRTVKHDSISEYLNQWEILANAIRKEKVSIDLTGGTDSRILVAILNHLGCSFETTISGQPTHPDVIISSEIAKHLNSHEHFTSIHKVDEDTLISDLYEIAKNSKGINDFVGMHRLFQLHKERAKRGISLALGGGAGELYKDAKQWRCALLSCNSKNRLVDKLVNTGFVGWGMGSQTPDHLFQTEIREKSANYKKDTKKFLKDIFPEYHKCDVFRLADEIFYKYIIAAPRGFSPLMFPHYSPLLDVALVHYGINLPKHLRFGHQFYREIIAVLDTKQEIASLPTTRLGMTLLPKRIIPEVLTSVFLNLQKRKVTISLNDPNLYSLLRKRLKRSNILKELVGIGLLNPKIAIDNIPNKNLGRLVSLWLFLRILDKRKN